MCCPRRYILFTIIWYYFTLGQVCKHSAINNCTFIYIFQPTVYLCIILLVLLSIFLWHIRIYLYLYPHVVMCGQLIVLWFYTFQKRKYFLKKFFCMIYIFSAPHEDLKALIAQAHRSVYRRESVPVITDLIDNIMSIPSCL